MPSIYITEKEVKLKKAGERLVVEKENKKIADIPIVKVDQVVIFGNATLTPSLISLLLDAKIPVTYLSFNGRFRGRLVPEFSKNSILRIEQYKSVLDQSLTMSLATEFVKGKLKNMRTLLLRGTRKGRTQEAEQVCSQLKQIILKLEKSSNLDELRGFEGMGSRIYFSQFKHLISNGFVFNKRTRRPPRDPVNALLSFLYMMLFNEVQTAVYLCGFDPYMGFLHKEKYGKPALVLDLMEEFRPVVVDSLVLTLINKRIVKTTDFVNVCGAVEIKDEVFKVIVSQFEERLRKKFNHPVFEYDVSWRKAIELQARLLSKKIQGEIDQYIPMEVR